MGGVVKMLSENGLSSTLKSTLSKVRNIFLVPGIYHNNKFISTHYQIRIDVIIKSLLCGIFLKT